MRIGILISGRGSNMVAIVDAVKAGEIPDSEVAVSSATNQMQPVSKRLGTAGLKLVIVERKGRPRHEHDAEIVSELKKRNVDLICLAGYMRLLSRNFIEAFPNKIVNIHPSLLPSFRGLDAQRQALEHGVTVTGCTVHFVNEDLDAGQIILQRVVKVSDDDTVETLSARILEQEHIAYVDAVNRLAAKSLSTEIQ